MSINYLKTWLHKKNRLDFYYYLLIIFSIFFFHLDNLLTKYLHGDFIAYWVPHFQLLIKSIRSGYLPFWNPHSYLGLPELFKLELVYFYPPTWAVIIINLIFNKEANLTFIGKSLELLQIFNLILGAIGMYTLLKKEFKFSRLVAFFAGLIFSLSIYITIQGGDLSSMPGKMYLPWITLSLLSLLKKHSKFNFIRHVFINFFLITLGYPYNYVYFYFFQIFFSIQKGYKKTLIVLLTLLLSVSLSAFFLLPNLHILNNSNRGNFDTNIDPQFHFRSAFKPSQLINVVVPMVFTKPYLNRDNELLFSMGMLSWGIFPFLLLVLGFASIRVQNNKLLPFVYLFILSIIISFGAYLNVPNYLKYLLPIIDKLRSHAQILSLTYFSGIIILSFGLNELYKKRSSWVAISLLWQIPLILTCILLLFPYVCNSCSSNIFSFSSGYSRANILFLLSILIISLYKVTKKRFFIIIGIFITLLEFSFYSKNIPYLRMSTSYSDYYKENSLIIEKKNLNNLFRYQFNENQFIYNTYPVGAINAQGYETVPYKGYYDLSRFDLKTNLSFSGVKYVVTDKKDAPIGFAENDLYTTVDPAEKTDEIYYGTVDNLPYFDKQTNKPYYVFLNKSSYQFYFVPKKIVGCANENCLSNEDPSEKTYIHGLSLPMSEQKIDSSKIEILDYKENNLKLNISTNSRLFIASSEIYDDGWSATNNGKKIELYNSNGGFRGFFVDEGLNIVQLKYYPPNLNLGIFISSLTLVITYNILKFGKFQKK